MRTVHSQTDGYPALSTFGKLARLKPITKPLEIKPNQVHITQQTYVQDVYTDQLSSTGSLLAIDTLNTAIVPSCKPA